MKKASDVLTGQEISKLVSFLKDSRGLGAQAAASIISSGMTREEASEELTRKLLQLQKSNRP